MAAAGFMMRLPEGLAGLGFCFCFDFGFGFGSGFGIGVGLGFCSDVCFGADVGFLYPSI